MINALLILLGMAFSIAPDAETAPSPYPEDSVDDAAIWLHPDDPDQSLILATLKASNQRPVLPTGILVYDLEGRELQFLQGGTPNNIDLRTGFVRNSESVALIAASHWYSNRVGLYAVDKATRQISLLTLFDTGIEKLRGLCMGKLNGEFYFIGAGSSGEVEQYRILDERRVELVNRWELSSETEGCVVDDLTGTLYIAEENVGLWRVALNDEDPTLQAVDQVSLFGPLKRGLEGLAILETARTRYLVVSVQERSRFALYTLPDENHVGHFRVKSGATIDGVSKTDGIAIYNQPLGAIYPNGLVVVHDDDNQTKGTSLNQNFKLIDRLKLLEALGESGAASP